MTTSERYRSAAHTLYDQAIVELEAGDLRQASEKFWGAAAQVLKLFAEKHDLPHHSHAHTYRVVRAAVDGSRQPELAEWFKQAEALHGNFYENWMIEHEIRTSADEVRRLIEVVERV